MTEVTRRKRRVRSDFLSAIDWWGDRASRLAQTDGIEVLVQASWDQWAGSQNKGDLYYVTDAARLAQYYIRVKGYALDQIMGDALGEAASNEGVIASQLGLAIEALSAYWVYRDEFKCWLSDCMKMPRPVIVIWR